MELSINATFPPFVYSTGALGDEGETSKNAIIETIVERSVAVCPKIEFKDSCQLESLREYGTGSDGGNSEAKCNNSCTTKPLESPLCNSSIAYPADIWNNELNADRTYEEKVCCSVGAEPRVAGTLTYDEIKALTCSESSYLGLTIGLSVAGAVIVLGALLWVRKRRNHKSPEGFPIKIPSKDLKVVLPPPSAPSF